jgi:hypothetical protein
MRRHSVTVSVKRYTGTQVERPETVKGEPKVGMQGCAEAADVEEGSGQAEPGRVYTHCGQDFGIRS